MLMRTSILAGALLSAAPAFAHVVFADAKPQAGSYYAGFLQLGHGCGDAATISLRVEIPESILIARPQPKPGWELTIEHEPLAEPVKGEAGQEIPERVSAITWRGRLPADQFDRFGIMMKLPQDGGPLYFPATQLCEEGSNEWREIPATPAGWHRLSRPAPVLEVQPAMHEGH